MNDNGIVKIPVTVEEERIAKAITTVDDNYENYKREEIVKLKRYFHFDGLHMIHLFGKVWLQYDNNVPKSDKGLFRCSDKSGYKWYEGWFRIVIGKYGFGMFFMDKVLMNGVWNNVTSRWEGSKNGR